MSADSLNKPVRALRVVKALRLAAWLVVGFIVSQFVVQVLIGTFVPSTVLTSMNAVVLTFIVSCLSYALGLVLVVGGPAVLLHWSWHEIRQRVGLMRRPKLSDVSLGVIGYAVYIALSFGLLWLAMLVPGFDAAQKQNLGFEFFQSWGEVTLGFVAFVVIAPFVEELLFRGFLYKGLRRHISFVWAALATSALFGIAHGQWNVALDTFALSLVLCYVYEGSQSIWPSVAVHMVKNTVAFAFLLKASSIQ